MKKPKSAAAAMVENMAAAREESDASAQFAIAWAELNGFALAVFRRDREQQRIVLQLGPAPVPLKPKGGGVLLSRSSEIARAVVARSLLAGVLALDVARQRGCRTALPTLRAMESP